MVPPAPGRLSITIGWPSDSPSFWLSVRAATSVPPLGAKPTMTRIGFVGQAGCASAGSGLYRHAIAHRRHLRWRVIVPSSGSLAIESARFLTRTVEWAKPTDEGVVGYALLHPPYG